jgi:DNA-damage-inducible protein D
MNYQNHFYMENAQLMPFEGATIRKIWHNDAWFFSIVDVIGVLTETDRARKYWSDLKKKLLEEGFNETSEKIGQLKMLASDGKNRLTDCANTEGVLRIVMSVPSPKAEPLKLWLAQMGKQAMDEAENPELLTDRQAELYRAKGYSEEWIARRVQTIETRKALTDEWQSRGVKEQQEYGILTATIAKGAFGVNPSEHAKLKGLERQNLRDHMTPLELIFTALSEEVTRQVAIREDAQGFEENHDAAQYGGKMAGDARKKLEKDKGIKVVTGDNFLALKGVKPLENGDKTI